MHFAGKCSANVAHMPRLVFVAGYRNFIGTITDEEAVFVGVRDQPFAFGRAGETLFDFAGSADGFQVGSQASLMLAIAGPSALRVGSGLALSLYITIIQADLIAVRTIAAGQHQVNTLCFRASKHGLQRRGCYLAYLH